MARPVIAIMFPGILFTAMAAAQDPATVLDTVAVRFVVTVPDGTPADEAIHLCGNTAKLGNWDGAGLKLQRQEDGAHTASIQLKRGAQVQYKATRGSWQTVERSESGGEIENRYLIADEDKTVKVVVASWANGDDPATRLEPTLTGDIRRHERFHSAILDNDRTLLVYLPPNYQDHPDQRYPVLYMHDGQNIFDAATSFAGVEWQVDDAAERLIAEGKIEPIIIVGMYNNANRMTEYTPRPDDKLGSDGKRGDDYARFVVQEVKPFIDRTYRTDPAREKTGIAGSSLGGLISLYMAREHADTFGLCGGVSPSLQWGGGQLLKKWQAGDTDWMLSTRFWIDMGTAEGRPAPGGSVPSSVLNTRAMADLFAGAGLKRGEGYEYLEVPAGQHNEAAWARRIDSILLFLYGR